jgi:glycosyltransferase involved in cell wall biosynthesis
MNRLFKHPIFTIKTICTLITQRPDVLIVQNPSILLTLIACIFKNILGYKLIVDAHNAGILPEDTTLKKLLFLYKYFQKTADITIVTNSKMANIVVGNNGVPFVLPDMLPDIIPHKIINKLTNKFTIVCICTFGLDEPYEQIVEAAAYFNNNIQNIQFYVTGNMKKAPAHRMFHIKPENVNFTGFLPEHDYWELLFSADLIIDLTNREDCLVCGAYEAVAAEVPIILSDTQILRNYFYKGTVFTKNTAKDIVKNISYAIEYNEDLKQDIIALKAELQMTWPEIVTSFVHCL